jgi:glycosyltransferase involved in cell wall biosynthesis
MRILYIVPYVPSPVRIRPYNLIRSLAQRGHQVVLWTLWTNGKERQELEQLRPICHQIRALPMPRWRSGGNCLRVLPSAAPLQSVYSWLPALITAEALAEAAPDVIHVEHLRGSRYGLALKSLLENPKSQIPNLKSKIPIVWDSVDCISHLFRQSAAHSQKPLSRWITRFELGRTEQYEGWLLGQFDQTLVISAVDRQALAALLPAGADESVIQVLPQGTDVHYFAPDPNGPKEENELVISGKMSYHANVSMVLHLVRHIMPLVWEQQPAVRLTIVGADPVRELLALQEQHPLITVTGRVGDVRPYLRRATAAVAPLTYGTGTQNKVLEAMACATPVVATPQAVTSLSARPGQEVLVGQDSAAFARAVLSLLADPEQQRRIGWAGRRFVEAHHDLAAVAALLEGIYDRVIQHRNPQGITRGSIPPSGNTAHRPSHPVAALPGKPASQ